MGSGIPSREARGHHYVPDSGTTRDLSGGENGQGLGSPLG